MHSNFYDYGKEVREKKEREFQEKKQRALKNWSQSLKGATDYTKFMEKI